MRITHTDTRSIADDFNRAVGDIVPRQSTGGAFTTFYTNPFTIQPQYVIAYEIGAWASGMGNGAANAQLSLPEIHWHNWASVLWDWFMALGKPILVGLPLLAISLATAGYFAVRTAWYLAEVWKWRARKRRRLRQ